jgi:opacity protein-like surface antigen
MLLMVSSISTALAGQGEPGRILVEVGLAMPYGDLNDNFEDTPRGIGADNGYELGFRYRFHLTPSFSVSPGFHFVDYQNFDGVHPEVDIYSVEATTLRYTVEFMVKSAARPEGGLRPFLAAGVGLSRNRAQGYLRDFTEPSDESANALTWTLRGGVQLGSFELGMVYILNRFDSWHIHDSDVLENYNWDTVSLRAGWILPLQ